jgi:predicted transcriptional regulator
MDDKTKTLKAIKKNHEDGLTESEIRVMIGLSRYEVLIILKELQIEQRIRSIRKGRFLLYKEIQNDN